MIESVGIIGAGTMGNGIAQVCAVAGLGVTMIDVSDAAIKRGLSTIDGSLDRLVKKEKMAAPDREAALARINATTDKAKLVDCDLVIEAATENEELKVKILRDLCASLRPQALVATNTSSISITKLAAVGTGRRRQGGARLEALPPRPEVEPPARERPPRHGARARREPRLAVGPP